MLIELEKVSVRFGGGFLNRKSGFYALREITAEIGGHALIIGESGAGKTTLARVMVGLQKITSGSYKYNGVDVWKKGRSGLKTIRREIQYVGQDPFSSFNPNKTIGESLGFVVKKHVGGKNVRENVIAALKGVGLSENEYYKYPHQMSGGQLQRANIGRALVPNPKVIVADEPTSMLDASYRVSIINLLADLANKGLTIIMITHDLTLARYFDYKLGRKVHSLILYRGRLVEEGLMDEILGEPLHPYTQYLVNNIIDLSTVGGEGEASETRFRGNGRALEHGCPFYPLCKYRREVCGQRFPEPREMGGRKVYCYLY